MMKKLVQDYAEALWNEKRLQVINEMVHEQVTIHSLLGEYYGREAMKRVVHAWLSAFPDLKVSEEFAIQEGERICIQWKAEGTHLGIFKGLNATGKKVQYRGTTVYLVQEGQITEYWSYLDMQHLMQQLLPDLSPVSL